MKKTSFSRFFLRPQRSLLLLGARGTGKSTFIRNELKPKVTIDLLKTSDFRVLKQNPSELESMTGFLKKDETVFIDEIQKIPELLNEVHRLIEDKNLIFYLSGSSARKLRKEGVNLLAGRATTRRFYPLTLKEIAKNLPVSKLLTTGLLPMAVNSTTNDEVNDYLFSYVDTYLKEEVFQEGLVRNVDLFSKFIELAGQYHGQIMNFENISREIGKSGDTVKTWFQILQDTLMGDYLEPYSLNFQARETKHSKFYFFDHGIARAAEGLRSSEIPQEKLGFYFESIILNELKTLKEAKGKDFKLFYYNVPSIGDIDFVIETKKKTLSTPSEFVTVDVKLAKKWDSKFEKLARGIKEKFKSRHKRMVGVYLGDRRLQKDGYEVFPVDDFIEEIWGKGF